MTTLSTPWSQRTIDRRPGRVLSDAFAPHARPALRAAALVVGGAALVGICAQLSLSIPGTPVPVTAQTWAVLVVGATLGWRLAALSMLLYVAIGGLGVPWFAHARAGWGGPTFGYLIGFVLAAALVGWLASRRGDRTPLRTLATMAAGTLAIYAVGVPWLAFAAHLSGAKAWQLGAQPFLIGDALKAALSAGILPSGWLWVRRHHGSEAAARQ